MTRSGVIDVQSRGQQRAELVALVVGDRRAPQRLAVARGLMRQGFRVMVATDCEHALRRFERHRGPIQLVVVGEPETAWQVRKLAWRIEQISPATRVIGV